MKILTSSFTLALCAAAMLMFATLPSMAQSHMTKKPVVHHARKASIKHKVVTRHGHPETMTQSATKKPVKKTPGKK